MRKLTDYKCIYFLGIGGIGMSAIAQYCLRLGMEVQGYDRQASSITDKLAGLGASIHFEDDPLRIESTPDLVIYTPAIKEGKLLTHFTLSHTPMIKRSEALGWITHEADTIAVGGTHGKTTTSSMISYLLKATGFNHTALLGGVAANYDSNFISEGTDLMVVEADEYDRSFLQLFPRWVVLTAMDADHLDIYGTQENMIEGYRQFIKQIRPGGFFLYRHDLLPFIGKEVMDVLDAKDVETFSFGLDRGHYKAEELKVDNGIWSWMMIGPGDKTGPLQLTMPGKHNVLNAIAACALVLKIGSNNDSIRNALPGYKGVSRRFEIRYRDKENILIDDYAHHPEELKAAITAAQETYGHPVVGVFQPHLYSRTKDLAKEFAEALDLLDIPVIIDIYPAREKPIEGISSLTIFDLMSNAGKKYFRGDEWMDWIIEKKPKVLITLGAGDIDKHIPELIRRLYKT